MIGLKDYAFERVMNGTWGEIWIDSDYMAEATGIEAKLALTTAEVKKCRTLFTGFKVTGISGTGTLKMNHVSSYFLSRMATTIASGKTPKATIITKLDDPEAFGAERIMLKDCVFTELTIANWEAGKNMEDSVPFSFSGIEILDSVDV